MTSELMASLELGARETGTRLITWPEILVSEKLSDKTRRAAQPYKIPVEYHGKPEHIAADGHPFGIERSNVTSGKYIFCPGVEADCGTEPIDTSDFERSSIYKKFVLYMEIIAQDIHRAHFGFPNLYIPIITTTRVRRRSMMELLARITGGKGSKHILFAPPYPAFTSFETPQPPSGFMLTQNWERVGHGDFNFLTS